MTLRLPRPLLPLLALLAALAVGLAGCRSGYQTETLGGQGVREWALEMDGARVEALAVWPVEAEGPVPALLLVHGDRGSAQTYRRNMFSLVRAGLYTMSISLPGFGESTGPEDLGGARSVRAIRLAVDYLAAQSRVRPGGLAVYGEGLGAAPALAAAAEEPRIRAVAVEQPIYDLAEAFPRLPESLRRRLLRVAGGPPAERPEAYRQRSVRGWADKLQSPLLVLHDPQDRVTSPAQAEALVRAVRESGRMGRLQSVKEPSPELNFRHPYLDQWVVPFVKEHLPPEKPLLREP